METDLHIHFALLLTLNNRFVLSLKAIFTVIRKLIYLLKNKNYLIVVNIICTL